MKKVLITGASGFIGKNLAEQLSDDYVVYTPSSAQLDLTDRHAVQAVLRREQFDIILHCACLLSKRNASTPPEIMLKKNLQMFFHLSSCREDYGKMIVFGSGAAYGRNRCPALVKETHLGEHIPSDAYGFSKYILANTALASDRIYDLTLFGVYGKYEDWRIRFLSNACCRAVLDLPIKIRQNVFFDYLYIDDLVRIVRWFMENEPRHRRYHVCTGKRSYLYTLARMVRSVSGKDLDIQVERDGYGPEYTGDNTRLIEELGGFQFTRLQDGITALYQYYLNNSSSLGQPQNADVRD